MQLDWEEILKSPELIELIFKKSGLSKEDWDEILKENDLDSFEDDLNNLLDEADCIIDSECVSMGYDSTYRLVNLGGLFFTKDSSADNGWEGPEQKLDIFYELAWFACGAGVQETEFEVSTSLDDDNIFKIIGDCDCPVTVNGVKYTHDGEKYIKAE
jgi:hypothetical protein